MPPVTSRASSYFEDYHVGQTFRHPSGRTISEADNTWSTLLTMNTNKIHFNVDVASRSEFQRLVVNSGLTLAIVLGISVSDTSQNAIANLGWEQIRLTSPVFVGDTLYAESIVMEARDSRSRKHAGIVTYFSRGLNQDGVKVVSYTRSVLIRRREEQLFVRRFPTPTVSIATRAGGHP